jgi:peptidoglycan lytic transglycosylase
MRQIATRLTVLAGMALALAGCGSAEREGAYKLGQPYQIAGRWYYPEFDPSYDRVGLASWYGAQFDGRATANGERFDRDALSAAHPTLPLPSIVRVTNLANHRQIELRVNDRGPFVGDRLIDLSQAAARELGYERQGLARVRVEFVGLADARGAPPRPHAQPAPSQPAPPPAALPVLVATPVRQCEGRFIQVGAFAESEHAWSAAARLYHLAAAPVSAQRLTDDPLVRLRVGPIADPRSAEATLDQLKRSGYGGAFIVGDHADPASRC